MIATKLIIAPEVLEIIAQERIALGTIIYEFERIQASCTTKIKGYVFSLDYQETKQQLLINLKEYINVPLFKV